MRDRAGFTVADDGKRISCDGRCFRLSGSDKGRRSGGREPWGIGPDGKVADPSKTYIHICIHIYTQINIFGISKKDVFESQNNFQKRRF